MPGEINLGGEARAYDAFEIIYIVVDLLLILHIFIKRTMRPSLKKSRSTLSLLRAVPSRLYFDYDSALSQSSFVLHNSSHSPIKIDFRLPQMFFLATDQVRKIQGKSSLPVLLYFKPGETRKGRQTVLQLLQLQTGTLLCQIFLTVTFMISQVQVPKVQDFGRLKAGKDSKFMIPVKSLCKNKLAIKVKLKKSIFTTASEEILLVQGLNSIQLQVPPLKAGRYRQKVQFQFFGNTLETCIEWRVFEREIEWRCQGVSLQQLNLGQVYFGQKVCKSLQVQNNLDREVEINLNIVNTKRNICSSPNELVESKRNQIFSYPSRVQLRPLQLTTLNILLELPPINNLKDRVCRQETYLLQIDGVVQTTINIKLNIKQYLLKVIQFKGGFKLVQSQGRKSRVNIICKGLILIGLPTPHKYVKGIKATDNITFHLHPHQELQIKATLSSKIEPFLQLNCGALFKKSVDVSKMLGADQQCSAQSANVKTVVRSKSLTVYERFKQVDKLASVEMPQIKARTISIPFINSPLYVQRPIGKYQPQKFFKKTQIIFSSRETVEKIWPDTVVDKDQARIVQRFLEQDEMLRIYAGPKIVDFGNIIIKSRYQRTFWIKNDTKHHIKIQCVSDRHQLRDSYFKPQIVPAGQRAGIKLVLLKQNIGVFEQCVEYVINGQQRFKFLVKARVVSFSLKSSRQRISFEMKADSLQAVQKMSLINSNEFKISLKIKFGTNAFSAFPDQAELNSSDMLDIRVTFYSFRASNYALDKGFYLIQDKMTVLIQTGQKLQYPISFKLPQSLIKLPDALRVDLPLFQPKLSFSAYNVGHSSFLAQFQLSRQLLPYFEPKCQKLLIEKGKEKQIVLQNRRKRGQFKGFITAKYRGKVATVQLSGQIFVPRPEVSPVQFNDVLLNRTQQYKQLVLRNKYSCSIPIIFRNLVKVQQVTYLLSTEDCSKESLGDSLTRIILNESATIRIELYSQVQCVIQHSLQLRLGNQDTVQVKVRGRVVSPSAIVSQQVVDFGQNTIDPGKAKYIKQQFRIKNISQSWIIIEIPQVKFPFIFEERSAVHVQTGEDLLMTVTLKIMQPGNFRQRVVFNIRKQFQVDHVQIELKASTSNPRLAVQPCEMVMRTVPLNTESSSILTIDNNGFKSTKVVVAFDSEIMRNCCKIEYVDGNQINFHISRLRVKITFSSRQKVSLVGKLLVIGKLGIQKQVPVSVSAANSLFSCCHHLKRQRTGEGWSLDQDKAVLIYYLTQLQVLQQKSEFTSSFCSDIFKLKTFFNKLKLKTQFEKPPEQTSKLGKLGLWLHQLLNHLLEHGYSVNHIRPYFLLTHNDFKNYLKLEGTLQANTLKLLMPPKSYYDHAHSHLRDWVSLLFQIIRVKFNHSLSPAFVNRWAPKEDQVLLSRQQLAVCNWLGSSLGHSARQLVLSESDIGKLMIKVEKWTGKDTVQRLKQYRNHPVGFMLLGVYFISLQQPVKLSQLAVSSQIELTSTSKFNIRNRTTNQYCLTKSLDPSFQLRLEENTLQSSSSSKLKVLFTPKVLQTYEFRCWLLPKSNIFGTPFFQIVVRGTTKPETINKVFQFSIRLLEQNVFSLQLNINSYKETTYTLQSWQLGDKNGHLFALANNSYQLSLKNRTIQIRTSAHEVQGFEYLVRVIGEGQKLLIKVVVQVQLPLPTKTITTQTVFFNQRKTVQVNLGFQKDRISLDRKYFLKFQLHSKRDSVQLVMAGDQPKILNNSLFLNVLQTGPTSGYFVHILVRKDRQQIKCYRVQINFRFKPIIYQLNFKTMIRKTLKQIIPLVNPYNLELKVISNLKNISRIEGQNKQSFRTSVSSSFTVPPQDAHHFEIQFTPVQHDVEKACINLQVNQLFLYSYQLTGTPLLQTIEDSLHMKVQPKKQTKLVHPAIQSDMYIDLKPTFKVVRQFGQFFITCQQLGVFTSRLVLKNYYKQLTLNLTLASQERKEFHKSERVPVRIMHKESLIIMNRLSKRRVMKVSSSCNLQLPNNIFLQSEQSQQVNFKVLVIKSMDCQILLEDQCELFVYSYSFEAIPHNQNIKLLIQLAKTETLSIPVHNPLPEPVLARVRPSTCSQIKFLSEQLTLPAFSTELIVAKLLTLQNRKEIKLDVQSQIGQWHFTIELIGRNPEKHPEKFVQVKPPSSKTVLLPLQNCFSVPVQAIFSVSSGEQQLQVDQLKLNGSQNNLVTLMPLSNNQMAVTFSPKREAVRKVEVVFTVFDKVNYYFPLTLSSSVRDVQDLGSLKAVCRQETGKIVHFKMLHKNDYEDHLFKIMMPSPLRHSLFFRVLGASFMEEFIVIQVYLQFKPLKRLTESTAHISTVFRQQYYNYSISLQAQPPLPDDSIVIETDSFKPKTISFKIYNPEPQSQPFQAYLTRLTPQLILYPTSGVMSPNDQEPQQLFLTFKPKNDSLVNNKVVIQTEFMQWNYRIKCRMRHTVPSD